MHVEINRLILWKKIKFPYPKSLIISSVLVIMRKFNNAYQFMFKYMPLSKRHCPALNLGSSDWLSPINIIIINRLVLVKASHCDF